MKDLFIIYNNQARSKGMAVVTFHRPVDAGVAQSKYNGKVIDGSTSFSAHFTSITDWALSQIEHKLKIELVTDSDELSVQPTKDQLNAPPSLLSRIAGPLKQVSSNQVPNNTVATVAMQTPYVSS